MGLPFEQWRDADGKDGGAPGCRTPGGAGQQQGTTGNCPAAPRKRRPAPGPVTQQRNREYYNGADIDDFFAAHNL